MVKYYHMIIQRISDQTGETRKEYISRHQGYAPPGWKCIGVCGFHEKPKTTKRATSKTTTKKRTTMRSRSHTRTPRRKIDSDIIGGINFD